ncbi:MAG: putative toxin-antitoxin system toxin component, PIN family [Candidatus Levybacteria bacterium]|nr:putative toxin-antitoxin system toxin component, PIN family [Candidatus Levybacteria bacterium]
MIKIVVDTNQYLSVFVFRGQLVKKVFELVIDKKIGLYISPALTDEIKEKLQEFKVGKQIENDVTSFMKKGITVEPTIHIEACRDPKDNFLLELAQTAHADYLITRDKDLLDMKRWKTTKIIKPEDFLPTLRKKKLLS